MLKKIRDYIAPPDSQIQVAAFNILALCGIAVSIITGVINIISGNNPGVVIGDFLGVVVSLLLIVYCHRTGNYRIAMILTVFAVFLGLFSALYFIQGGYHSGIPSFFIFGVVFTAFLLDGPLMIVMIVIELVWYSFLCINAYYNPVTLENDEKYYAFRVVMDMVLVALSLAITMYCQIRIYRKKQQELNAAIRSADEANRAKSDFLAKMSHDIRTPLNTMLGMNELIVSNTSSARIRGWVNDSNVSGRILLSLIDDMLDLSRIEARKIDLAKEPWNTWDVFGEIATAWRIHAAKAGLTFNYIMDEDLPSVLLGDESAIRKITDNLLSNSVKYTKEGYVSLSVSWDKALVIKVSDTGSGISPEHLKSIYKPFERGAQELYKDSSGSGLGLAIVKELVDVAGGTVDCHSVINEGTEFTVRIPQKTVSDEKSRVSASVDLTETKEEKDDTSKQFLAPDARILLVDDNQFNRKVVQGFLEPSLIQIDDVGSGYEALEMIDIRDYDLVLMDHRMPGMDGVETLERIRSEYPDFHAPIVMLTADVMNEAESRFLDQGFSGFLSKPVSSSKLYETIAEFIPEKIIYLDIEPENVISSARIESLQDQLMPYGIDVKFAMENNAGNTDEFLMRTELFDSYADETMEKLRESDTEENYYLQLHSVKSIARGVGAFLLSQLCETAEFRKDIDFAREIKPVILSEYDRVRLGVVKIREEIAHS
ncbi:MAG: response regulator [Lachnospiraceae bacterium]|nr:response regulator [Lachnospiraceae bacterium]